MPYTDWNYTNPGWTNENPPAINESNLNDIANALSKLNLTSEQLSQLGLTTTNGLGDIISKLVENIENINTELDQTNTELSKKGSLCARTYTYAGNNQASVSIDISDYPYDGYTPAVAFVTRIVANPNYPGIAICIYNAPRYATCGNTANYSSDLSFTKDGIIMYNVSGAGFNDSGKSYRVTVI